MERRNFLKIAGVTAAAFIFNPLSFLRKPTIIKAIVDQQHWVSWDAGNLNPKSKEFKETYLKPAKARLQKYIITSKKEGYFQVGRIKYRKNYDMHWGTEYYRLDVMMGRPINA